MITPAPAPLKETPVSNRPLFDPAAPPWFWLWIILFLTLISYNWSAMRDTVDQFHQMIDGNQRMESAGSKMNFLDTWCLVPPLILDILSNGWMMLAVAVVLFPHLRAKFLEKKYHLRPPADGMGSLEEIRQFVQRHDPSLGMTANVGRLNQVAFVYPTGYRKASLAVFGGLLKLWHADRPAAEAVLLHEIAHHRRGDVHIMGAGSLFQTFLKYLPLAWLLLYIVPTLVQQINLSWRSFAEAQALNAEFSELKDLVGTELMPASDSAMHSISSFFKTALPGIIFPTISGMADHMNQLVFPVLAYWTAELSADRMAARFQNTTEHVARAFRFMGQEKSWWRRILFCLYHPPIVLRRWFLDLSSKTKLLALLLLYPVGLLIKLFLFHLFANGAYLSTLRFSKAAAEFAPNTLLVIRSWPKALISMGLLLLAWPLISNAWGRLFSGITGVTPRENRFLYWMLAAFLLLAALVCWMISKA